MSSRRWLRGLLVAALWSACDAVDDQSLGVLSDPDAADPDAADDVDAGAQRDGGGRGNGRDGAISKPCCEAWAEFWDASPDRCDETQCRQMPPPPPPSRSVH